METRLFVFITSSVSQKGTAEMIEKEQRETERAEETEAQLSQNEKWIGYQTRRWFLKL